MVSLAIWIAFPTPVHGQSGPVAKLAGTGYESIVYADTVSAPYATATDSSGNIYYSDWITNTVYRESPGPNGFTQIVVASFGHDIPSAIAVDEFNDVFVVVESGLPNGGSVNGVLYEETFVDYCGGTGCTPGWTQSVIPTTGLLAPMGLAVAIDNKTLNANYIFIADTGNNRLVQLFGQLPLTGYVQSTLPFSGLKAPEGIAVDANLDLFIADSGNNRVLKEAYSLNGPSYHESVIGSGLSAPRAVAVQAGTGSVAIADAGNKRVLVEYLSGSADTQDVIPTPGLAPTPNGVAFNTNGQVVVTELNPQQVVEEQFGASPIVFGQVSAGTTSATASLVFTFTLGGKIGAPGVYAQGVSGFDYYDTKTGTCLKGVTFATGATCTLNVTFQPKVSGAISGAATLTNSAGATIATGYLQGTGEAPLVAFLPPTVSSVGASLGEPSGVAVDIKGDVFISELSANKVIELPLGSTTPVSIGSGLSAPKDLAVDGAGAVYIFDSGNHRVVKETPNGAAYAQSVVFSETSNTIGTVTTTVSPYSMTADGSGNVFMVVDSVANSTSKYEIYRSVLQPSGSYDTVQATFAGATTAHPQVVDPGVIAIDAHENLFIAGGAGTSSYVRLLKYPGGAGADYKYTTVALSPTPFTPEGIAVDGNGNLYYTTLTGNNGTHELQLAIPSASGYTSSTVASNLLVTTELRQIAVDNLGDIYLAEGSQPSIEVQKFSVAGTLNFGNVQKRTMSNPLGFTVENIGNQELILPALSTTPNPNLIGTFVADSSGSTGCPESFPGGNASTIAAGSYCLLTVYFEPQAIGSYTGDVEFIDNNLNRANAEQLVPLAGKGVIDAPIVSWSTPAPIIVGTALSATQLDAKASFNSAAVTGQFVYSPTLGTVLAAGSHKLSVTFTPTDKTDYSIATATVTLVVNQPPQPTITWPAPAAISYGTALSATQLDATATYNSTAVAGKFVYTPALGAVLNAGSKTLSVTFTPTNSAAYSPVTATVTLVVNTVPVFVVADSFSRTYGAANPTLTASYVGLVNGDTAATAVTGAPTLTTLATKQFPWGLYDISIAQGTLASTNYTFSAFVPGTLWITQAPLTIAADNISVAQGASLPALTYTPTGFVNGETAAVLTGAPTETTTETTASPAGTYPIRIGQGTLSSLNYTFNFVPGTVTVTQAPAIKPAFSHPAGTYPSEQNVTISDATVGATIYYTTNGETPTTSSLKYSGAIAISTSKTIKAIAVAPSHKPSLVAEVQYIIESPTKPSGLE